MYVPVRRPAAPVAALAWLALSAAAVGAQTDEALIVAVPHPITSNVFQGIKGQIEGQNRREAGFQKVIFDFNPEGKDAISTDDQFGECRNLAKYIYGLPYDTIAYVHGKVAGHSVLPALACRHLAMTDGGSIGPVVPTEGVAPPGAEERLVYRKYFAHQQADAEFAIVQKMLDPNVHLAKGKLRQGGGAVYLDARDMAALDRVADVRDVPGAGPGEIGSFTGPQAKELDLCETLVKNEEDLALQFGLARIIRPTGYRTPVPYRYTLSGEVTRSTRESMARIIRNIKAEKGNYLFLTLDRCHGGDLDAARGLADDLIAAAAGTTPEDQITIVAFIPDAAPDTATVVALGCSEIVMSKRKDAFDPRRPDDAREAEIGDFERLVEDLTKAGRQNEGTKFAESLKELAEKQKYPGVIAQGMLDRDLEIVWARNVKNRTQRKLMSRKELEGANKEWQEESLVKPAGQLLKLSATRAYELGIAQHTVETQDPAEVYAKYGVDPATVKEVTPGWLDEFASYIRREWVTVLLVVIGFTGLLLELKVPGLTVPGIIAALCFIVVFWAHSRIAGQTAIALAILLFILGLVLLGLEIFVLPGFGVCGIFGILCMLAGLSLVAFDKIPAFNDSAAWGRFGVKVSQYLLGMIGSFALAFLIARFLPRVPYANRLMLGSPADKPGPDYLLPGVSEAAGLLGAIGTANTPLRPAGVVRFADKFVDVVSDGGFIAAGTRVQVIAVEGTRIVVKEV